MHKLVQRIRDNFGSNRALCDKSTKFGTVVVYAKVTILKIGGTLKMPWVNFGGHFSKWPPEVISYGVK